MKPGKGHWMELHHWRFQGGPCQKDDELRGLGDNGFEGVSGEVAEDISVPSVVTSGKARGSQGVVEHNRLFRQKEASCWRNGQARRIYNHESVHSATTQAGKEEER